jgi:hypothetical protein
LNDALIDPRGKWRKQTAMRRIVDRACGHGICLVDSRPSIHRARLPAREMFGLVLGVHTATLSPRAIRPNVLA